MAVSDVDLHTPHRGYPADVIPLQYHAHMLLDDYRMSAFHEAIVQIVTPGSHVLDLGAGTGVLAWFAANCGARVTAVERDPAVLATARASLSAAVGDSVDLVHADARGFVPDEPVDVVVCEMLHVGLLREKQIEVITSFKALHAERFPDAPPPRFIPEACLQAVQPVEQDFTYFGYTVHAPVFQDPFAEQARTQELAYPQVFQRFFYADPLPQACTAAARFTATRNGRLNAVRIITKNLLTVPLDGAPGAEWLMNYLVVPVPDPIAVYAGDDVRVRFEYHPGDEITELTANLRADVKSPAGAG